MEKKTYIAIGLMSGTSLDGLDICLTQFTLEKEFSFTILGAKTIKYSEEWNSRLKHAHTLSGQDLMLLSHDFGNYCGECVLDFLSDYHQKIDFIASHGHTVFHNPSAGFTSQIGSGAAIYAKTKIQTICDFRSVDVALGGQGAPLVPIGDLLLFSPYQSCLNLGGISNISIQTKDAIEARDLGYCNLVLNYLCQNYFGLAYDKGGELGRRGIVEADLLEKMLQFTNNKNGKSLAREDFEVFLKLCDSYSNKENVLRTSYAYISHYLSDFFKENKISTVLLTGGGAHNSFLVEQIQSRTEAKIIVPETEIIDFKEALIFAFLGVLRLEGKNNCLKSVTKASKDNIGGAIYG